MGSKEFHCYDFFPQYHNIKFRAGDIDFFVYHDTLGGYHDIPDILVEFKLLEIKVTLKLN